MKLDDFVEFCTQSMAWCKGESEKSTSTVMDILAEISEEAKQVSSLSEEAISALGKVKEEFAQAHEETHHEKIRNLTSALSEVKEQHTEIDNIINPIVSALQFQDRITQNMDNLSKMLHAWKDGDVNQEELELGKSLLKLTTMADERDIVRKYFPDLPEEEEEETGSLFF